MGTIVSLLPRRNASGSIDNIPVRRSDKDDAALAELCRPMFAHDGNTEVALMDKHNAMILGLSLQGVLKYYRTHRKISAILQVPKDVAQDAKQYGTKGCSA
jgi:hypothetical protein